MIEVVLVIGLCVILVWLLVMAAILSAAVIVNIVDSEIKEIKERHRNKGEEDDKKC